MAQYKKYEFGHLRVERLGKRRWKLLEDWVTPYGRVPKGFETNGVSSGVLESWANSDGSMFEAAVLHDWMYEHAIKTKKEADKAFYNTALLYGVNVVRAYVSYLICVALGKGKYK